ncbi:MAG: ImmA/IrrE family metallo-endopeptidase [Oscillospiraceae bacterium]|nr:ImmA/IrrE family metallo-endopeptidase [Oscillospiraceae bacterium]
MKIPLGQKTNGMYLFSSKDFDSVAELVLHEYAPYMLEKAQPLQIEALADEAYSLTIIDRYISAHGSVLGIISFGDFKIEVMTLEKQRAVEKLMTGTIVIDARLLPEEHHHRRRFTVSHELAHWIIHRQMHYADNPQYSLRRARPYIVCREAMTNRNKRREFWTEDDWMEWQADRFASAMLMPASVFYPEAQEVMRRHHAGSYILDGCGSKATADVITELTEIFDVSRTAVRIRLKQAGLLRSIGIIVCD